MAPTPPDPSGWQIPTINLHIEDLSYPGATDFLTALNPDPYSSIRNCVVSAYRWLYEDEEEPNTAVEELTITARSMPGVAHTFGDSTKKHIHISMDYIHKLGAPVKPRSTSTSAQKPTPTQISNLEDLGRMDPIEERKRQAEVLGVLTHEAVHCFQYNGKGKCPGGLIEGIADYVRLRAGLAPPHWKRPTPSTIKRTDKWDSGYERTAFFLDWLEVERCGGDVVKRLNMEMRDKVYDEFGTWLEVTGETVQGLWEAYRDAVEGGFGTS